MIYKNFKLACIAVFILEAVPVAFSQNSNIPEALTVHSPGSKPQIELRALDEGSLISSDERNLSDNEDQSAPGTIENVYAYSSFHHIGMAFSWSNAGITRGMFKSTRDNILQDKVTEKLWGIGLVLDMGWSEDSTSSLRTKWMWARGSVKIPSDLKSEYPPDSLEESLNIVGVDFVLRDRVYIPQNEIPIWWGGGIKVQRAITSSTNGPGSARQSRLRHSTILAPLLSLGIDMEWEPGQELLFQADWLLPNALQLSAGLRVRL